MKSGGEIPPKSFMAQFTRSYPYCNAEIMNAIRTGNINPKNANRGSGNRADERALSFPGPPKTRIATRTRAAGVTTSSRMARTPSAAPPEGYNQIGMENRIPRNWCNKNNGQTSTKINICTLSQVAVASPSDCKRPPSRSGSDDMPRWSRIPKATNIASAITAKDKPVG